MVLQLAFDSMPIGSIAKYPSAVDIPVFMRGCFGFG